MRRIAALLLLAGCVVPGLAPGRFGFTAARAPLFGQVTIAPNPSFFGEPADAVAGWWNVAAGRPLFALSSTPQIVFWQQTPIIAKAEQDDPGGRRVVTWADQRRNPDGTMHSCVIFYDPTFVAAGWPGRHLSTFVFAHEVKHCLELDVGLDNDPTFWQKAIANQGPTAVDTAQLKAAGYI